MAPQVGKIYALGQLDYDFCSEARRDSFQSYLGQFHGGPGQPDNPHQVAPYLKANPAEASRLMWILRVEDSPLYRLLPEGPFASDVYAAFVDLYSQQVAGQIERVSLPGHLTDGRVKTRTGQVLPVVKNAWVRGLWGWSRAKLVESCLQDSALSTAARRALSRGLEGFLDKVYFELANTGFESRHRALNFAATNAFQASQVFVEALRGGFELADIEVVASPFCRPFSECWDVKLKFFDSENLDRSRRVFRFTIDVSDILPVTLGPIQSWSTSS
jgi:cyanobactin maturation PatA/PatG family protease